MVDHLTHYEALGVSQNATQAEIRSAYKALVLRFHPDKNDDKETATTIFNRIQEAYETLNNPDSRDLYDMALYLKSAVVGDDKTYISETAGSPRYDLNENLFEGFNLENLRDMTEERTPSFAFPRTEEFDFEEFKTFKDFIHTLLFANDETCRAEELNTAQSFCFPEQTWRAEGCKDGRAEKKTSGLNSTSHKISKLARPTVRVNKKN